MLSRLSSRNIALIILGACVLLGVLWYSLMYSATQANIAQLQTEIGDEFAPAPESLLGRKQISERARANVKQLCKTVQDIQQEQRSFLQKLPASESLADLLDDLGNKFVASRADINSISPSTGTATGLPAGVRSISLSLSLEGTWASVSSVLKSIEALQRFSKVETVSLSGASTTSYDPKLATQIAMTTYVYDNPTTAGSGQLTTVNPICVDQIVSVRGTR